MFNVIENFFFNYSEMDIEMCYFNKKFGLMWLKI